MAIDRQKRRYWVDSGLYREPSGMPMHVWGIQVLRHRANEDWVMITKALPLR